MLSFSNEVDLFFSATHIYFSNTNNTIQQPRIETNPATQSTQPTRNRRLALSNKIDASSGNGENEKQDRCLQRQAMAVAMAMARDIQPETHWSKAHSTQKQWETKEERAIGGGDGDRRKLAEERLMRGRKID